ncbi:hypothetical protein SERLA73DRAFT_70090 [Serpula lacrymans var. lacrymans S7.3]|uniref:Uncharacterized protein n=2 Tax=Serpula lacrymans var. lacrymans TaxID=341189 RepID=F8PLV5_SERL3|nr:uncharacterized protein SERLADRAFT_434203 [Serpula lacrymans var. lacrymans S7.9]EGO02587.1 hypothetical protein SERLA73DRAFT_70090 [Serpula lacrymans var. lacrymans S7.3]EGO28304.1 hypothetical protein SERLADRAFT_434203 [Serpula lacrymans var. lacrymans S7.9]
MADLIGELPEAGPSQIQPPPPARLIPEIQEWMQRKLEAKITRRVTEATEKEKEGRRVANRAAERAEEEVAEYRARLAFAGLQLLRGTVGV